MFHMEKSPSLSLQLVLVVKFANRVAALNQFENQVSIGNSIERVDRFRMWRCMSACRYVGPRCVIPLSYQFFPFLQTLDLKCPPDSDSEGRAAFVFRTWLPLSFHFLHITKTGLKLAAKAAAGVPHVTVNLLRCDAWHEKEVTYLH